MGHTIPIAAQSPNNHSRSAVKRNHARLILISDRCFAIGIS